MSSSFATAANSSATFLKWIDPGMCLARKPQSLDAITSLKFSARASRARSASRSISRLLVDDPCPGGSVSDIDDRSLPLGVVRAQDWAHGAHPRRAHRPDVPQADGG